MKRGKREARRRRRWPWLLAAAILVAGAVLGYRAYREWMDEIIWPDQEWAEGFSYLKTLHMEDGGDIGPALEALEELQKDGPVQLRSQEEAAAFDAAFGAYGLETLGEHDFAEGWLWVTGCVIPQGVWLEDSEEGLRATVVQCIKGETRSGSEWWGPVHLEDGLVVCVTPKVELAEQR